MKAFIILGFLITSHVFAATPLMKKHIQSGFIEPEDSFEYDCSINDDRHVVITRREGTGNPHTHSHHFSTATLRTIRSLVHVAAGGRIVEGPASCDGGDKLLYGYHHGSKFILDEDIDCGTHKINRSRATASLKRIARRLCGF